MADDEQHEEQEQHPSSQHHGQGSSAMTSTTQPHASPLRRSRTAQSRDAPTTEQEEADGDEQAAQDRHPLYYLHLLLFTTLHALHAIALLLHAAASWTSPRDARRQALEMGRRAASLHARHEADAGKDGELAARPSSRGIKMPKHLALVLQTPYIGTGMDENASRQSAVEVDEEARALAVDFLRHEVAKVVRWCQQLGVGQLTVMDTDGLLAQTGLVGEGGEEQEAMGKGRVQNGNGHAHEVSSLSRCNGEAREGCLKKRKTSSSPSHTSNGTAHHSQSTQNGHALSRNSSSDNSASSSSREHIHTLRSTPLRIQVLAPTDGEHIFALAADDLRLELDRRLDAALSSSRRRRLCRRRRGEGLAWQPGLGEGRESGKRDAEGEAASAESTAVRRERVKNERADSAQAATTAATAASHEDGEEDDGWTQIHSRAHSGDSSSHSSGTVSRKGGREGGELDADAGADADLDEVRSETMRWIEEIDVARMNRVLLEHGYPFEPDFMILHGVPRRAVQLCGFPAWAVRLTEIFHDPLADPRRPISLTTFVKAINYFNRTEQRFGK